MEALTNCPPYNGMTLLRVTGASLFTSVGPDLKEYVNYFRTLVGGRTQDGGREPFRPLTATI